MWKYAFIAPAFLVIVPSPVASFVVSPHSLAIPRHLSGIYGLHNSQTVLKASSGKGFSGDTLPAKGKKGKGKKSKKASFELLDIVDTAAGASTFKTFTSALSNTDLVEATLKGQGPFTVFAPTDEAFANLPADTLEKLMKPENNAELAAILTHHVVPGVAKAAIVATMNGQSSLPLNGASLAFEVLDGTVTVGGATVVATDFLASNGVIHAVDTVILPPAAPSPEPPAVAPAEAKSTEPAEPAAPVAEAPTVPAAPVAETPAPAAAPTEPADAPVAPAAAEVPAAGVAPAAGPMEPTPAETTAAPAAGVAPTATPMEPTPAETTAAPAAAEVPAAEVPATPAGAPAPAAEVPATPAAPAAETPVEEAKARTLEDDLPQLQMEYELTTFVTKEGVAKSEQQSRLQAVQERLAKTIELKDKVESMYAEELVNVMEKLDDEVAAEMLRVEDIQELTSKFEAVLAQKAETVERDETLLENMKSTLSLIQESSIQRTLESAIEDKAALCAIEQELMAKMQECLTELQAELKESNERAHSMADARSKLPDPTDPAAVRAYGWQDVEALNKVLQETAASAVKREAAVEAIKEDFANAMDRRRQVLSGEVPPLASTQPKLSDGESFDVSSVRTDSSSSTERSSSVSGVMASDPPTSDELAAELTAAASEVGSIVLQLGAQLAGKAAKIATSSEAKGAAGSAGAAVGGLKAALAAASAAWDRAMEDAVTKNVGTASSGSGKEGQASGATSSSSDGDWWVKAAWNQVLNDPEVAKALKASTDAAGDAASGFGAAGSAAISASSNDESDADSSVSLATLQASIVRLAKVTSAVASRVTGSESNFILPPGK